MTVSSCRALRQQPTAHETRAIRLEARASIRFAPQRRHACPSTISGRHGVAATDRFAGRHSIANAIGKLASGTEGSAVAGAAGEHDGVDCA